MSLMNVVAAGDALHIFTDAAGCTTDGRLAGEVEKIFLFREIGSVLAGTGYMHAIAEFAAAISMNRLRDFDHFKGCFVPNVVHPVLDIYATRDMRNRLGVFDLLIAGYSRSVREPQAFLLSSLNRPRAPAMKLLGPITFLAAPEILTTEGERDAIAHDPERHGLALAERQRELIPARSDGGEPIRGIGVRCIMTTITAGGIAQRTLREWPDKIGETIEPERLRAFA